MIYLSPPALWLPEARLDNEEVLERVHARYRGPGSGWPAIEKGVRTIFEGCRSEHRYKELDPATRFGTAAVRAARRALADAELEPEQVELLIYGAICREYLEPATAHEVAGRLGIEETRAMDVSSACASQILGIATACAWMRLNESIETALVTGAELPREHLTYDIQSYDELPFLGAGVTLGDAASAWVLRRQPIPGGCLRVVHVETIARPQHWQLSQTPLSARFSSQSSELLRVGSEIAVAFFALLERVGWPMESISRVFLHQPGHALRMRMIEEGRIDPARAIDVHAEFGNTGSTSVSTGAWASLRRDPPTPGERMMLLGSGAGLSGAAVLAEWVD